MKKTMKLFAAITIMSTFAIGAMAQKTDDAFILGKAEVLQGISVNGGTPLNFGRVSPGFAKTIDLENNVTGGQVGEGTETTGNFTVSASAESNVNIKFTGLPENLVGTENLPIGSYIAGYNTESSYTGGTPFTPGTGINLADFPTNDVGGINLIYVFIGGTVSPTTNQAIGNYQANITLTATYN